MVMLSDWSYRVEALTCLKEAVQSLGSLLPFRRAGQQVGLLSGPALNKLVISACSHFRVREGTHAKACVLSFKGSPRQLQALPLLHQFPSSPLLSQLP
jgi:hypothetical protein